jgi:hypothetical protein
MKMYHVTTLESAKKISQDGASSSVSQDKGGGFFLWTNPERAKKYTGDDYIKKKGTPCILVFDIDFSTKDFDIDYEISAVGIANWAKENLDLIVKTTGFEKKETVIPKPDEEDLEDNPNAMKSWEFHGGKHISFKRMPFKSGAIGSFRLPKISGIGQRDPNSENFLKILDEFGLLEKMEKEVFDAGNAPAIQYKGSSPLYPSEILDVQGNPLELDGKESVKESLQTRNRWLKMAGLLKG